MAQTAAFHLPRAKAALDGGETLMRAAKNVNADLNGPLRGLGPQEAESAGARACASVLLQPPGQERRMRVPGRQTSPPLRSRPSAWCEAWDADMAPHPGTPGQTPKMRESGRKVGLPAVRLNVLPFCDACTGENQFSTDPTTGICRNTPCKHNRCSRPSSGGQLPA